MPHFKGNSISNLTGNTLQMIFVDNATKTDPPLGCALALAKGNL